MKAWRLDKLGGRLSLRRGAHPLSTSSGTPAAASADLEYVVARP
jgi:hypothetical protein